MTTLHLVKTSASFTKVKLCAENLRLLPRAHAQGGKVIGRVVVVVVVIVVVVIVSTKIAISRDIGA